ncbi:adenylate/guanylate cyclase domain-containing protein [Fulvivirga sp. M361]|uniref:adenylate/guanylate cyclase domain-containing protein n=1 Tax=Fulvivirga sp. M361 TaxID=2594266 RepID=UPI00117A6F82|nr:adenylate/guanylate cyclase domain-containing protein [Fulvivirga sp. M361]TRX62680.1 adenylate/guanylate cyclase domain-containing protein [Fulvivirga sp. M361]
MKLLPTYVSILSIYLIGMDLYFCFWYLGSDGDAIRWSHKEITFYIVWVSANLAVVSTMGSLIVLNKQFLAISTSTSGLNSGTTEFLFKCLFGILFFIGMIFLFCGSISGFHFQNAFSYIGTSGFLSISIYHMMLVIVIISVLNLNLRLGGIRKVFNYFFKWIYPPRQVEMGFMFLDLNDSTGIAEKLTSDDYSALLRDCFNLLDKAVAEKDGIDIYQYVGDEAVLYWDYNDLYRCREAIRLFHSFKERLSKKMNYFLVRYNVMPTFKSALHGGTVTQSEIGQKVIHTAFHGDVVNTTSRILSICHKLQTDFLMSESYFMRLKKLELKQKYEKINDVILNGKLHKLTVYKPFYGTKKQDNKFYE